MSKLIDADKAMEIVRDRGIAHPNAYYLTNYAMRILQEAPAVDAVEVVRCWKCKYHEDTDVTGFKYCRLHSKIVRYNDFCSYGKRKEGAD